MPDTCQRPLNGPMSAYFPNVVVQTHLNQRLLFYDDLLRGKLVVIHCMSIRTEPQFRTVEKLAQVQRLLGDRVGGDVFLYSVTTDPERDTPRALRAFAERFKAGPGWLFVTGDPVSISTVRGRLYNGMSSHDHSGASPEDCSMAMYRFGNEAVGLWASVAAMKDASSIAQRVSWIETRPAPTGPPKRGGPPPLPEAFRKAGAKS